MIFWLAPITPQDPLNRNLLFLTSALDYGPKHIHFLQAQLRSRPEFLRQGELDLGRQVLALKEVDALICKQLDKNKELFQQVYQFKQTGDIRRDSESLYRLKLEIEHAFRTITPFLQCLDAFGVKDKQPIDMNKIETQLKKLEPKLAGRADSARLVELMIEFIHFYLSLHSKRGRIEFDTEHLRELTEAFLKDFHKTIAAPCSRPDTV